MGHRVGLVFQGPKLKICATVNKAEVLRRRPCGQKAGPGRGKGVPYEERMQAENAALVEAVAALRRENMELEKTRYRLQLEVDVLKKADEILKRGGASI